ncbi:MAG: sulfotransferase, partial [Nitrospinota bacterium]
RELREMLSPPVYDRFFSFAFVRNPWDWQVSLYFYMLKTRDHFQHRLIHSMQGFEEYIRWRVREDRHLQKDFVTDEAGNLLVDFVGKYENLEQDFAQVCARIGIQAALPHLNQSGHRNYREYYNERTRNLVYDAFKEDIEFFHYTF